jgi:secreted PhoX family phosphatase
VLDGNALRWTEHDGDPAARRFRWSTDAAWDATRPRELRTDRLGRLWAATTHTVRVSGPKAGTAQPLLTARHSAEFTAITFTPDARTLFAGVRLPGAAGGCAVLAVRHREDRPVGTA